MSVQVVGGGRLTAVINAVFAQDAVHTARLKGDTVRLIKENVPTVRPNEDLENDKRKKTWLMGVQHPYPPGVIYHLLFRFNIFMSKTEWGKRGIVIFVDLWGQLSIDSLVEVMAGKKLQAPDDSQNAC
ncbi:MAG: hypothetical protein ABIG31_04800 [Candidatus Omnitrophota bacterium]